MPVVIGSRMVAEELRWNFWVPRICPTLRGHFPLSGSLPVPASGQEILTHGQDGGRKSQWAVSCHLDLNWGLSPSFTQSAIHQLPDAQAHLDAHQRLSPIPGMAPAL